jgi:hypothetical protein
LDGCTCNGNNPTASCVWIWIGFNEKLRSESRLFLLCSATITTQLVSNENSYTDSKYV